MTEGLHEEQLRCATPRCNRRLLDVENGIKAGGIVLEIACPKCGKTTKILLTAVTP